MYYNTNYTITDYKILHDINLTYLSEQINRYIKEGYQIRSCICYNVDTKTYYIEVVKYSYQNNWNIPLNNGNLYGPNGTTIKFGTGWCLEHGVFEGAKCPICNNSTVTSKNDNN